MDFAVGEERVGDHVPVVFAQEAVGGDDVAGGVGVHGDGVEVALGAVLVERFEEGVVVAGQPADEHGGVGFGGLDHRVGGLQQRGVGGGVGGADPPAGGVLLVPQLIRGDVGAEALGEAADERGVILGVGGGRVFVGGAGLPLGRVDDVDDHFRAGGELVEEPFVVGDPVGGVVARGGLEIGPGGEHAHPMGAERLEIADVGAEAVGEHDPRFGGTRGGGGGEHQRHQPGQQRAGERQARTTSVQGHGHHG